MHLISLLRSRLVRPRSALIGLAVVALSLATAPASFATNPFPITESFTHTSLGSGWNMGGSAALTASTDGDGSGWLRLTGATNTQFG